MTQTPGPLPIFPQLNGIFVLNKPSGPSSAQCLRIFKKLGQRKAGHAGTLDPLASGVLLVLLGQAVKLSSHLLEGGMKTYRGVIKLGEETDTWDSQGEIIAVKPWGQVSAEAVKNELARLRGRIEQIVPPYSAAKHEGQPLYKLARKNLPVPLKTKQIEIYEAEAISVMPPLVEFRISCSSGSYIRSLAHSLGKRLGCGGHLLELVREFSHPYSLDASSSLAELTARPELLAERLMPIQSALPDWPRIPLSSGQAARVRQGAPVEASESFDEGTRGILCEDGEPIALARLNRSAGRPCWTVLRGLWN